MTMPLDDLRSDSTQPASTPAATVDRFERVVVFRVARGYFLFLAFLALLGLVAGAGAVAWGLIDAYKPLPASPPAPMPPEPLTYLKVEEFVKVETEADDDHAYLTARGAAGGSGRSAAQPSSLVARDPLEEHMTRLKPLFPDPPYSWDNVVENYCKVPSPFGCLQQAQRIIKMGVRSEIPSALKMFCKADPAADPMAILDTLEAVLLQAPVDKRRDLISSTVEAYCIQLREHWQKLRDHEAEVARLRQGHQEAVRQLQARKDLAKIYGLYAAAGAFALLIAISVFLAHFAIERHLRLLQELVRRIGNETR